MVSGCSHLSGQSDLSEDGGRHEGGKNREKSGGKRIIAGVGRNTKVAIAVIARPTGTRGWVNGCSDVLPANRLSPSIRLPTLFLLHLSSFASTSIFAGGIWRRSSFPLRPRPSAKLPPILCTRNSPRFSFRTVKNREDYKFFLEDNIKAAIIIYIKLKGRSINIINTSGRAIVRQRATFYFESNERVKRFAFASIAGKEQAAEAKHRFPNLRSGYLFRSTDHSPSFSL